MLPRDLSKVDAKLVVELCEQATPESSQLDFKRDLPSKDPTSRAEFLKDVSALANSSGGDIVYGILEKDGCAHRPSPITGESADAAKRRLGQVLDGKVEPRILGVQFHEVSIDGGYVLVCRVPQRLQGLIDTTMTALGDLSFGSIRTQQS